MRAGVDSEIERRIAGGETANLELKASLADSKRIIETIAAMATVGGGTIFVGVSDDGTVPPGDGPHLAFGRAFHRAGRSAVAMNRDEYERRLLDRLRESSGFERRHVDGMTTAEIDSRAVARWQEQSASRLAALAATASPQEVLERLHLGHGEKVSIGGWLLFGKWPQKPFPQAAIRAQAQRGAATDSQVLEGPLCQQIDDAVAFVARNLRLRARIVGVRREEQPEIPLLAVREVVANAVAHRDYRSTAAIQLRVTDAGVEVWNPGHLPPPITPALLRERHPSVPANPLIARALYLAGYIEEWGTGTLRTIELMRANGNPEPEFLAAPDQGVRVTLPVSGAPPFPEGRPGTMLARFAPGKPFGSSDYAKKAKVSVRTAALDLRALEQRGLVRRTGTGRATRWVRTFA